MKDNVLQTWVLQIITLKNYLKYSYRGEGGAGPQAGVPEPEGQFPSPQQHGILCRALCCRP